MGHIPAADDAAALSTFLVYLVSLLSSLVCDCLRMSLNQITRVDIRSFAMTCSVGS
jgi:hypothetical protein